MLAINSRHITKQQRLLLSLVSLITGFILAYYIIIPIHGLMILNLVAVVEPYFRRFLFLRFFQQFTLLGSRYLFFPFFVYLGYRFSRAILLRIASRIGHRGDQSTSVTKSDHPKRNAAGWLTNGLSALSQEIQDLFPSKIAKPLIQVRLALGRFLRTFLRFLGYVYMIICVIFLSTEAVLYSLLILKMATHPKGAIAFYRTCNQCHGFNRPFNFNHTAAIWEITVDRMIRHTSQILEDPFPIDKREDIIEFLCAVRSYSDKRLMRSKCYPCHLPFRLFDRRRTEGEWECLIDRIQRTNPFYITPRQADQLLDHIVSQDEWRRENPARGSMVHRKLEDKIRFEKKCGTCHTIDIIFMPHIQKDDWPSILNRMGGKEPDHLTPEESIPCLPLIERALQDKQAFLSDYPHSTMREAPYE